MAGIETNLLLNQQRFLFLLSFFPLANILGALAYFLTEPSAKVSLALEILAAVLLVNVREKFRVELHRAGLAALVRRQQLCPILCVRVTGVLFVQMG